MVGLSLTFCIHDIIHGLVQLEDVEKIIAGTAWTDDILESKLDEFCRLDWRQHPEKAREVFWELWKSGRIEQPRLQGDLLYFPNISKGHWIK